MNPPTRPAEGPRQSASAETVGTAAYLEGQRAAIAAQIARLAPDASELPGLNQSLHQLDGAIAALRGTPPGRAETPSPDRERGVSRASVGGPTLSGVATDVVKSGINGSLIGAGAGYALPATIATITAINAADSIYAATGWGALVTTGGTLLLAPAICAGIGARIKGWKGAAIGLGVGSVLQVTGMALLGASVASTLPLVVTAGTAGAVAYGGWKILKHSVGGLWNLFRSRKSASGNRAAQ